MTKQAESLIEAGIVHEPTPAFVESTNVWQFMQAHGIDDYEELVERTTTEVDGHPSLVKRETA